MAVTGPERRRIPPPPGTVVPSGGAGGQDVDGGVPRLEEVEQPQLHPRRGQAPRGGALLGAPTLTIHPPCAEIRPVA